MGVTQRIKMYFHVVYGSDRRRYGGAGRNSLVVTGLSEGIDLLEWRALGYHFFFMSKSVHLI